MRCGGHYMCVIEHTTMGINKMCMRYCYMCAEERASKAIAFYLSTKASNEHWVAFECILNALTYEYLLWVF